MSLARAPHLPQLPDAVRPVHEAASLGPTAEPSAGSYPLPATRESDDNPYTSLILGMINRLDEPDRLQWLRLSLGLAATAVEADRAILIANRDGASPQVVSSFGLTPGEDPLLRSLPQVEATLRSREALLLPGLGSPRSPSLLCVPLVREQRLRGALLLESARLSFRPGDLTLARAVARRIVDAFVAYLQAIQPAPEPVEAAAPRPYGYANLIARSRSMQEIFELVDRIAATDHPVIIQGESGTGKELVARAIHFNGRRRERPFIAENCAALSDSLLEAELFGYVKGAFTGADRDRKGFFELADGGTLFLDEIGEMSEKMQKDLLRVLQEGEVRPVGGKKVIKVDVRIICASNRDLAAMVRDGAFRKDFYYRLNVMTVELPPLRERREDIPLLVDRFLENIGRDTGTPRKTLAPAALEALQEYDWPGNIRELKNEIKRVVALARGDCIQVSELRYRPKGLAPQVPERAPASSGEFVPLEELERRHVLEALRRTDGNKARAAQLLGINKATVFRKLKNYGLI
jgi:transcriptional regulator with GAF, ATPase, and Fis domain